MTINPTLWIHVSADGLKCVPAATKEPWRQAAAFLLQTTVLLVGNEPTCGAIPLPSPFPEFCVNQSTPNTRSGDRHVLFCKYPLLFFRPLATNLHFPNLKLLPLLSFLSSATGKVLVIYEDMHLCIRVPYMWGYPWRLAGLRSPGTGVVDSCELTNTALGTKCRTSGRAASALNHRVTSPDPLSEDFLKCVLCLLWPL